MKESDLLESTSEAIRMIKQGAVRVNDEKVSDTKFCLPSEQQNFKLIKKNYKTTFFDVTAHPSR